MKKTFIRNPFEFQWNLSAFISAARSITWIMQKEYSKVPGFADWYEDKQKRELSDELFKKFNSLRVLTVKKKPISPTYRQTIRFGNGLKIPPGGKLWIKSNGVNAIVRLEKGDGSEDVMAKNIKALQDSEVKLHCYVKEFPDYNLFDICEQYLNSLEKLVLECEQTLELPQDSESADA
jgi:hypothetical protein